FPYPTLFRSELNTIERAFFSIGSDYSVISVFLPVKYCFLPFDLITIRDYPSVFAEQFFFYRANFYFFVVEDNRFPFRLILQCVQKTCAIFMTDIVNDIVVFQKFNSSFLITTGITSKGTHLNPIVPAILNSGFDNRELVISFMRVAIAILYENGQFTDTAN